MNNDIFKNLVGKYPITKSLRFELIPEEKTLEFIEKGNVIPTDEQRNIDYKKTKKLIDEYHKDYINRRLKEVTIEELDKYYDAFLNKSEEEEIRKIKANYRNQIANHLKSSEEYNKLFGKDLLKEKLEGFLYSKNMLTDDIKETIGRLKKFTTYFQGYNENRKNMYSNSDNEATSIPNRLIDDNLPIFVNNIVIYQKIKEKLNEEDLKKLELNIKKHYPEFSNLDNFFTIDYYNKLLTQDGIDMHNAILGGISEEDDKKLQGLNEYTNLYNQNKNKNERISVFTKLKKQILSDRNKISFLIESINNDEDLIQAINEFYQTYKDELMISEKENKLENLLRNINTYETSLIYINSQYISTISNQIFNDWSYIKSCMIGHYDKNYTGKKKFDTFTYIEERQKIVDKKKEYSINYLEECISNEDPKNSGKIIEYITKIILDKEDFFNNISNKYNSMIAKINSYEKRGEYVIAIKEFLDSVKKLQLFVKNIIPDNKEMQKDDSFYGELIEYYDVLSGIKKLYDKARNYLTKKIYSDEKFKINFGCPTLFNGWDVNKETSNLGVILRNENKYYLAVIGNYKKVFEEYRNNKEKYENETDYFEKVEYKLLPGANKMIPKVIFSKKNAELFKPNSLLVSKYKEGLHKKGEKFNLDFMRELINYFKYCINIHPEWKNYNFKFSDTNSYMDISGFYKEVEEQGYKLEFLKIPVSDIKQYVDEGKIYLFQIYNKDFSENSKGKPNLHTMFFRELFSKENLDDVVFKLNGQAEMFYRPYSIERKNMVIHQKGEKLKNENKNFNPEKEYSVFNYDIIKDKRYTVNKFHFHVPITINFKEKDSNNINKIINGNIRNSDDIYILGIDRGERHLIYLSLIDINGNIIKQESLNFVNHVDYHDLLDKKEEERKKAKLNWQTIQNIKELKQGYLSQVINKISEYILKYNCIIAMEFLNPGFKNSRKKIEKEVYQKFEKALISKLNYLTKKEYKKDEPGGILKGLQLTIAQKGKQYIGYQNGIIYYVPAWKTSKIDPATGFVDLFYIKYRNINEAKNFIKKFDNIIYNSKEGYFEFSFDYKNFNGRSFGINSAWTVCTYSDRIKVFRNPENNNKYDYKTIDLTKEFNNLFNKYNVDINNIKESIEKIDNKEFFESFISLFKSVLQMRNSDDKGNDYIISPVHDKDGKFFDSRKVNGNLPDNADANGAYNIARKGLMYVEKIKASDDNNLKLKITYDEWLSYVQKRSNI